MFNALGSSNTVRERAQSTSGLIMRRTSEEAEQTRQGLISAGIRVMQQKGYSATRVEDIAHEAGVTRGAFYHHFRDKLDIYDEILLRAQALMVSVIRDAHSAELPVVERLQTLLHNLFGHLVENAEYQAILTVLLQLSEQTSEVDAVFRKRNQVYIDAMYSFSPDLDRAISREEIRKGLSSKDIIDGMLCLISGVLDFSPLHRSPDFSKQKVNRIADIFIRGLQN